MMPAEAIERFARSPVAYGFVFVLGALWGSFANVCILRIPAGKSIVSPGSHCFACGAPVSWYDNLPILSYLILRGRCRRCGARYSPRYLFVELAAALLFLAAYHYTIAVLAAGDPLGVRMQRFATYSLFILCLLVLALIDLDSKRIPDKITYPAVPIFLGLAALLRDLPWWEGLVGVAVGYGVVRAISDGYYWLTKREGLGYGDGKLLAVVGALLGWRAVVFSLFGGAVLGSVIGVAVIVITRRRHPPAPGEDGATPSLRHVELPFGPFLAAAAIIYLFLQRQIAVGFRQFL